jgi:Tfp pilus assembly protein PilO
VPPGAAAAGANPAAPQTIGLQMQVTGDYFAILSFLEKLRDGERLVTVETFSLSKAGEANQLSASIGGRMYQAPQAASAAASPLPSA